MKNLRTLRESGGWSRFELAKLSGVSTETIERAEKTGRCTVTTAISIATALGVSLNELVGLPEVSP